MKRNIIISTISILTLGLAACGGVDQESAADDFISVVRPSVESAGVEWTAELETCLRGVVTELSDDELKAVSDQAESLDPEIMARVTEGTQECVMEAMGV